LGGNAPFIVFDDADIEQVVEGLLAGKFRASGQTCVSPNRVFVQDGIHDRLVNAVTERVCKGISKQEQPLDNPDTIMGGLINSSAVDKVKRLVQDAVSKGAAIVTGGDG